MGSEGARGLWKAGIDHAMNRPETKKKNKRKKKKKAKGEGGGAGEPKVQQTLRDGDELAKSGGRLDRLQPMISTKLWSVRVSQLSAGYAHTVLATECGRVYTFGRGNVGQLGTGAVAEHVTTPHLVDVPAARGVAAGMQHTLVVTRRDTLIGFGDAKDGQLGVGKEAVARGGGMILAPSYVTGLAGSKPWGPVDGGVASVAAGHSHTCVIDTHGSLCTFGLGNYGQLGHGGTSNEYTPKVHMEEYA
jgi:alpha-tubulin suppressor-like RCC1 family protein